MIEFLRKHRLSFYFVLTFLLSWSIWVPLALDRYALLPTRLDPTVVLLGRLLGTLGPALSAILVTALTAGGPGVKRLVGQLGKWRVGWRWWVAAGVVFPALIFVAAGLYRLLPGAGPLPYQAVTAGNLVAIVIILAISVLGEEIGWRGFALPGMQERWAAVQTSLFLGTIHTLWHLPFWIVLGELETFGPGYWLLSWAFVLALSIYLTWLMNNTGNSLLMAVVLHGVYNLVSVGYLPLTTVVPAYLILSGLAWIIALVLIARFGARQLAMVNASR